MFVATAQNGGWAAVALLENKIARLLCAKVIAAHTVVV